MRSSETRKLRNRYYGKTMRNAVRKFRSLEDKNEATAKLPGIISMIDKLSKRTIIHKNKAGNLKSKLTRMVNSMS
ncbi:30S ribosomal protein S20 [Lentimicrobium sp.]